MMMASQASLLMKGSNNGSNLNRNTRTHKFICSEKYILTGSNDGTVKLWTMKNGNMSSVPLAEFYDHENPITAVSITSDGKYASAGADDGKIIVWDIRTGGEVTSYQMGRYDNIQLISHT